MAHEIENMFSVKETPWHRLGKVLREAPNSENAIKLAGLDWEVGLKQLMTEDEELVDHKAAYRKTDGRILGVVGNRWTPFQNTDAFKWFDPFVESGEASYETAGSLRGGARVWVLAKLNREDSVVVRKSDDRVRKYILLSNGHDGVLAARVGFTPVRVVCANTMAMAHGNKASKLIRVRHSKNIKENMEAIREVMNLANQEFEATAEQFRALSARQINESDLRKYVHMVFVQKQPPKDGEFKSRWEALEIDGVTDTKKDGGEDGRSVFPRVQELFENGRGAELEGVKGTWWGAYNAVNEYLNWERGKDEDKRLDNLWYGQGASMNQKALQYAYVMATG